MKDAPVALTRCYFSLKLSRPSYCPGEMTESFRKHILREGDAKLERIGCSLVKSRENRNKCMDSFLNVDSLPPKSNGMIIGKACCEDIQVGEGTILGDFEPTELKWFANPPELDLPDYGYSSKRSDRCNSNVDIKKCFGHRGWDNGRYFERYVDEPGPRFRNVYGSPKILLPMNHDWEGPYARAGINGEFYCLRKIKDNPCELHYKKSLNSARLVNVSHLSLNFNEALSIWANRVRAKKIVGKGSSRGRIHKREASWNVGTAMYTVKKGEFAKKIGGLGFMLGAGYSGSTAWFFQLAEYLRLPLAARFAWRLALIGYFAKFDLTPS